MTTTLPRYCLTFSTSSTSCFIRLFFRSEEEIKMITMDIVSYWWMIAEVCESINQKKKTIFGKTNCCIFYWKILKIHSLTQIIESAKNMIIMMMIMSIVYWGHKLKHNSPSSRNFNPVIILNLPNDLSSLHVYIRLR